MSARVASQRHTRPKKLVYKQNVPIFRENEIDLIDLDGRQTSNIETGVEAAEQNVSAEFSPALRLCTIPY